MEQQLSPCHSSAYDQAKNTAPSEGLVVPIGIDSEGNLFYQDISKICPEQFCAIFPPGSSEHKHTTNGKRSCHPQQVGAILAPSRAGAVGNSTHHRVGNSIPDARYQEQHRGIVKFQPEYIGIKEWQVIRQHFPKHRRSHVAKTIPDFFS